jgi:universal stress protein A
VLSKEESAMTLYRNILLAVDFFPEGQQVIDKAVQVARENNATLNLIHVLEPLGTFYTEGLLVNIETDIHHSAEQRMDEIARELKVDRNHQFVRSGRAAFEIHRLAKEHRIDLIIIGGHGQSGWQLLLGSTANSVLHGAECDVLVVRLQTQD